jgi:hypothetical protein
LESLPKEMEMKASEYRVVETNGVHGLANLVSQVNDLLAIGWEPTGGVYVVFSHVTKTGGITRR